MRPLRDGTAAQGTYNIGAVMVSVAIMHQEILRYKFSHIHQVLAVNSDRFQILW